MKKWGYLIGTLAMFLLSMINLYEHNITAFTGWLVACIYSAGYTAEEWL